jgi:hypothetical protein
LWIRTVILVDVDKMRATSQRKNKLNNEHLVHISKTCVKDGNYPREVKRSKVVLKKLRMQNSKNKTPRKTKQSPNFLKIGCRIRIFKIWQPNFRQLRESLVILWGFNYIFLNSAYLIV